MTIGCFFTTGWSASKHICLSALKELDPRPNKFQVKDFWSQCAYHPPKRENMFIFNQQQVGKMVWQDANSLKWLFLDGPIGLDMVNKAPYTTHHWDLYALVDWPSLHTRRQTHWLQVIYKSLLGKALPYLSSLVTIAAPTHSTRSSRYISLVTPKTNSFFGRLSFQFSAANDWNELQKSLKLERLISLTSF